MELYLVKVKYDAVQENGSSKQVSKLFATDALSFTEAESRIAEEIGLWTGGEYAISSIRKVTYAELIGSEKECDGEPIFFDVKVRFILLDEKSGKEKMTYVNMLVCEDNLDKAKELFEQQMKGTMADYEVVSVKENKIDGFISYIRNASREGSEEGEA